MSDKPIVTIAPGPEYTYQIHIYGMPVGPEFKDPIRATRIMDWLNLSMMRIDNVLFDVQYEKVDWEEAGKRVREAWMAWALSQTDPKPSWLLPWEEMEREDQEADIQIAQAMFTYFKSIDP